MPAAICAALAAAALVVACISRYPTRPAIVSLAFMSAMVLTPLLPSRLSRVLELHVLDVGQGDAILLRTPNNRWMLFDAGPEWTGGDAGRSVIVPYLRRRGGSLEAFILSHPHADHVGGGATVFASFTPRSYFDAAFAGGSQAYKASLVAARDDGIEWHRVHPGDSLSLDGVLVSFLAPDSVWTVGLRDPNLASTIALVRYGAVRFLLVGDAEKAEEDWLVARYGSDLSADVLKVGHHGSSTSTSDAFLAAVHPELAVISVGARNRYGHPSLDVLGSLSRAGVEVLRTDKAGTVVVRTDGSKLEIEESGRTWELARRSSKH
jgi:competence protein ComEC